MNIITPESITPQQHRILLLLYRFRFLNRIHIQHFLHHKSDTRITAWLHDLTERKVICRIYSKKNKNLNTPPVYFLDIKSRHILKTDKQCQPLLLNRVYTEKKVQSFFREHWLHMADLYFLFEKRAIEDGAQLSFYTTTDLSTVQNLPLPLPDAYVTMKQNDTTKRFFIELINGKTPWFQVEHRIKQYISYHKAGYWQSHTQVPIPRILLICPNTGLKAHILTLLKKHNQHNPDLQFYVALYDDVIKRGLQSDTWEKVL